MDQYDGGLRLSQRELVPAHVQPGGSGNAEPPDWTFEAGGHAKRYDYSPVNELVQSFSADGESVQLEYDVRQRLLRRERRQGRNTRTVETFRADPMGNYYETDDESLRRVYGPGNRVARRGEFEYIHDQRGYLAEKRRLSATGDVLECTTFEWTSWGLPAAVVAPDQTRTEFKYDAFARRIAKQTSKSGGVSERHHYVWDLVSMVHDVKLGETNEPQAIGTYLFEGNDDETRLGHAFVATNERGPGRNWTYYVSDIKGLPETLVDGAGRVVGRYEYTAFGCARLDERATASTPFCAPGQQEDRETGLFYNRYRYYDPNLGRFISPDPIGIRGGLNLYAHGPNPIAWIDPMGWLGKHYMETDAHAWLDGYAYEQKNGTAYLRSGWEEDYGGPCPPELATQSKCHTEQKFAHALIKAKQNGTLGDDEDNFVLRGDYPPCPNCHAALMRASKETGKKIEYTWKTKDGEQRIKYDGGTSKAVKGKDAATINQAYEGITLRDDWGGLQGGAAGKSTGVNDYWGINKAGGEYAAYRKMCEGLSDSKDGSKIHSE